MSGLSGLTVGMVTTGVTTGATTGTTTGATTGASETKPASSAAVDDFLAYMKKSLAERMADAWLASHGLDREKLKSMSPAQRESVLKQMAEELQQQLKQAAAEQTSRKTAAA